GSFPIGRSVWLQELVSKSEQRLNRPWVPDDAERVDRACDHSIILVRQQSDELLDGRGRPCDSESAGGAGANQLVFVIEQRHKRTYGICDAVANPRERVCRLPSNLRVRRRKLLRNRGNRRGLSQPQKRRQRKRRHQSVFIRLRLLYRRGPVGAGASAPAQTAGAE